MSSQGTSHSALHRLWCSSAKIHRWCLPSLTPILCKLKHVLSMVAHSQINAYVHSWGSQNSALSRWCIQRRPGMSCSSDGPLLPQLFGTAVQTGASFADSGASLHRSWMYFSTVRVLLSRCACLSVAQIQRFMWKVCCTPLFSLPFTSQANSEKNANAQSFSIMNIRGTKFWSWNVPDLDPLLWESNFPLKEWEALQKWLLTQCIIFTFH